MIDHVLGRPSVKFRKIQVLAVVSFWSFYLFRGNHHGPPVLRRLSRVLSPRLTAWQTLVITLLWLYLSRNFGKLVGLECPEPLANLYTRAYFRATWVTTALDAGFWTAMRIRRKWLRDLSSLVFSLYYLIAAEQADEKVRKVRGMLTVEHLRISWNKGTTPYLSFITSVLRPRLMRYPPRAIRIPRPAESAYKEPVSAWLYFDGPISALKNHSKVVLDIPGGGFVAMTPRHHDDKLLAWAGKLGLPILSLEYKKAPEYPYPYALNECYDVYHTLVASRGRCIGLSGETIPRIVITGDSAGGNLATSATLMILQPGDRDSGRWQGEEVLPVPEGVVLIYPGLDMNIGNWMTDDQMSLIRDRRARKTNNPILRRKSEDYNKLTPNTPHHSDDEEDAPSPPPPPPSSRSAEKQDPPSTSPSIGAPQLITTHSLSSTTTIAVPPEPVPQLMKTRLAMSSMLSYFNDRILTPEMMRAMIILYIGPHNRPDFSTDYLLSPLLAPETLLARFPRCFLLTGERDPLVDDTVIFAGRVRAAKAGVHRRRVELGLEKDGEEPDVGVEVSLIPGISHGFLQFCGIWPEGRRYVSRCSRWIEEIFKKGDEEIARAGEVETVEDDYFSIGDGKQVSKLEERPRHHHRVRTESSGDEDRPLEMSMLSSRSSAGRGGDGGSTGGGGVNGGSEAPAPKALKGKGRARRSDGRQRDKNGNSLGSSEDLLGRRKRSMVSLASSEDLLGRRMKGLAGGLMGMLEHEVKTP